MEIVLLILAVVTVVLLLMIVIKLYGGKKEDAAVTNEKIDNLSRLTLDGLSEMRRENAASSQAMRGEVGAALENIGERMNRLSEKNAEGQLSTVRALADMREKLDSSGRQQTEAVNLAIERLQNSTEKKLEEMRLTVDEKLTSTLTTRLDSSFKSVSEQLSNVYKSLGEMKELSGSVTALNRIFTNVKTRGNWAETQLEGILDSIIPGM